MAPDTWTAAAHQKRQHQHQQQHQQQQHQSSRHHHHQQQQQQQQRRQRKAKAGARVSTRVERARAVRGTSNGGRFGHRKPPRGRSHVTRPNRTAHRTEKQRGAEADTATREKKAHTAVSQVQQSNDTSTGCQQPRQQDAGAKAVASTGVQVDTAHFDLPAGTSRRFPLEMSLGGTRGQTVQLAAARPRSGTPNGTCTTKNDNINNNNNNSSST